MPGWAGAEAACANADSRAFLASWLADLAAAQREGGAVPAVVPNVLDVLRGTEGGEFEYGSTGWGGGGHRMLGDVRERLADDGVGRCLDGGRVVANDREMSRYHDGEPWERPGRCLVRR
jgi:hypothetical protein